MRMVSKERMDKTRPPFKISHHHLKLRCLLDLCAGLRELRGGLDAIVAREHHVHIRTLALLRHSGASA